MTTVPQLNLWLNKMVKTLYSLDPLNMPCGGLMPIKYAMIYDIILLKKCSLSISYLCSILLNNYPLCKVFFMYLIIGWVAARLWWWMPINSLSPWEAIWRRRSGWTLAQVLACCLTAPSHYLKPCWLITRRVLWYLPKGSSTGNAHESNHNNVFENYTLKIKAMSPRGQWVKCKYIFVF